MLDASAAAAGSPPAKAATPGVESAYAQATALFAAARATETAVWMVRSGELQLSVRGSTWEASGQPVTLRYARGDLLAARTLVELSVEEAVQATVSLPPLALTLSSADDAQNSASERAEAQHRRQLIGASLAPSGHWDMLTLDALLRAASRVRWPAGHSACPPPPAPPPALPHLCPCTTATPAALLPCHLATARQRPSRAAGGSAHLFLLSVLLSTSHH